MKKILTILLLMLLCTGMMVSCSNSKDDVPEGLQIVDESASCGYVFYGPEGWTVSNRAGISACYVSPINNTSISFAKAAMPEGTLDDYFDKSFEAAPYMPNVIKRGEACNFGNAKEAHKYLYTYTVGEHEMACMQILVKHEGSLYIFTYNSYGDVNDESSQYRTYLEQVQLSIDSFRFTEATTDAESEKLPQDEDGYVLVTDKSVTGFELFLPADYEIVDTSTLTTAKINDKANVSLTKATGTGVSIGEYWNLRREELSGFVTDIVEIAVNNTNTDGDGIAVVLGDLKSDMVASYEYTYVYGDTVYHVYQVMGVDLWNGYVFTYTATEDEYSQHLDEITAILEKVKF